MAKVTKLQKIEPNEPSKPNEPNVDSPALLGVDQNRNCLFVLGYFIFVYLAMVLAFWMFGQITHQSDRRLGDLHGAKNATEIRDALISEFGSPEWLAKGITTPTLPTAEEILSDSATKLGDTITNATKDAVTTGIKEGAADAVENISPK